MLLVFPQHLTFDSSFAIIDKTLSSNPMTESIDQSKHHIYQAIGIVEGILEINEGQDHLIIEERVYPATTKKKTRLKHLPGQTQNFRVYPNLWERQLAFKVIHVTDKPPGLFTLKGCWESREDGPRLVVYRNRSGVGALSVPVTLDWKDAPAPNGQFWQLVAELSGTQFTVLEAVGPFEPPKKAVRQQHSPMVQDLEQRVALPPPIPKAKSKPAVKAATLPTIPAQAQPSAPALPLTIQDIRAMATSAKISLTCKLSEVPKHRELADKRIEFFSARWRVRSHLHRANEAEDVQKADRPRLYRLDCCHYG